MIVFSLIIEIIVRIFVEASYPLLIFCLELIIVAISILLSTMYFLRITDELFEKTEFEDEKSYFKKSLWVFFSIYMTRTVILFVFMASLSFY